MGSVREIAGQHFVIIMAYPESRTPMLCSKKGAAMLFLPLAEAVVRILFSFRPFSLFPSFRRVVVCFLFLFLSLRCGAGRLNVADTHQPDLTSTLIREDLRPEPSR